MHRKFSRLELMKISKTSRRWSGHKHSKYATEPILQQFLISIHLLISTSLSLTQDLNLQARSSAQVPLFYRIHCTQDTENPTPLPWYAPAVPVSGVASAYRTTKGCRTGCQAINLPSAPEHGIQVQVIGYNLQGIYHADIRNLSPPRTRRTSSSTWPSLKPANARTSESALHIYDECFHIISEKKSKVVWAHIPSLLRSSLKNLAKIEDTVHFPFGWKADDLRRDVQTESRVKMTKLGAPMGGLEDLLYLHVD